MSVYQKLQQARITLQNTELKKSGKNTFAGYSYFELGDFLPTIQKIFADLGLCGIVSFSADLASLRVVDSESKEEILFTSPMGSAALKGCHEVQNIGAVETYQRRYLWVAAMEIVEHDALDSAPAAEAPAKKSTITPTTGALDNIDGPTRKKVEKLAIAISSAHAAGNEWSAYESWDQCGLDADGKVALWSLLDSKVRSSIKQLKATETATAVA